MEDEGVTLEFRHIHILKKLLAETFKDNFKENFAYAKSVVEDIDPQKMPAKRKEAEDILRRIERLKSVPISMKALIKKGQKGSEEK